MKICLGWIRSCPRIAIFRVKSGGSLPTLADLADVFRNPRFSRTLRAAPGCFRNLGYQGAPLAGFESAANLRDCSRAHTALRLRPNCADRRKVPLFNLLERPRPLDCATQGGPGCFCNLGLQEALDRRCYCLQDATYLPRWLRLNRQIYKQLRSRKVARDAVSPGSASSMF